MEKDAVITAKDMDVIYEVPLLYSEEGLDEKVTNMLNIWAKKPDLSQWVNIVESIKNPKKQVDIAVVGKYVKLIDSYKSLNEALVHGGIANNCKVNVHYIDSEDLEQGPTSHFDDIDGILVPGGFGDRGIEGKIKAINHARVNKIPYFGPLSGDAACRGGDRAKPGGPQGSPQHRVRRGRRVPPHLPHRRVGRQREQHAEKGQVLDQGRHHAPGFLSLQAEEREALPSRPMDRTLSMSATGTGTNST